MKHSFLIKSTLLIFIALISFNGFSQDKLGADELSDKWTLLSEKEGVQFFVKKVECNLENMEFPLTFTFIKINNTTDSDKDIHFQMAHHYTDRCGGCDESPESLYNIIVPANSSIENDCTFNHAELSRIIDNPNLYSLNKPLVLELVELIKFSLK